MADAIVSLLGNEARRTELSKASCLCAEEWNRATLNAISSLIGTDDAQPVRSASVRAGHVV